MTLLDGLADGAVQNSLLLQTTASEDVKTMRDLVNHPAFQQSLMRILIEDDILQPHHKDAYGGNEETLLYKSYDPAMYA